MKRSANLVLRRMAIAGAVGAFALTAHLGVASAQSPDKLAERLTTMRAEVETLSAELTDIKSQTSQELRSLARQKADLELEREREKVRIAKLRSSLNKKRTAIASKSTSADDLVPIYEGALAALKAHVASSLPFRRADRASALNKIEEQRKTGILDHERALSRLWAFVEDEFRMTGESGLFRQTIELNGEQRLADVVRIGMVMLFFRTQDGLLGHTVMTPEKGWSFTEVEGSKDRRRLRSLFDAFKKQIRVGLFVLPNALAPWKDGSQ